MTPVEPAGETRDVQVLIVGAGPYGLSLAAHMHAEGVSYACVGIPME